MRKRIIAFYDVLLFAIICSPMIVTAVILSLKEQVNGYTKIGI